MPLGPAEKNSPIPPLYYTYREIYHRKPIIFFLVDKIILHISSKFNVGIFQLSIIKLSLRYYF